MMKTLLTLTIALSLADQAPKPDAHAGMNARGAHVMGFDQDKTTHAFRLHADGAAVDIAVKDPADTANRDAIRAHLPHITQMFADGNFEAPMLIHATDVPGTGTMAGAQEPDSLRLRRNGKGRTAGHLHHRRGSAGGGARVHAVPDSRPQDRGHAALTTLKQELTQLIAAWDLELEKTPANTPARCLHRKTPSLP